MLPAFACACALLAAGGITSGSAGEEDPSAAAAAAAARIAANPVAGELLENLSATRERPLFAATRRAPAPPPAPVVVQAAPPAPPPPPSITLYGIVSDAEGTRAMLRTGTADKALRVRVGDSVEGWKVSEIEGRRLVLSLEDRSVAFTLFDSTANRAIGGTASALAEPPQRPAGRRSHRGN
jgi:general secretion pathway protein N